MKYVIDIDALKECLKLLPKPTVIHGNSCVHLSEVFDMIDAFPKEEADKREVVLR